MLTVYFNRQGSIIFTDSDVGLHKGDKVKHDGKIYLVVERTYDANGGFYQMLLHESEKE